MISNEKVQILIRSTLNALSFAGALMFGLGERIVRSSARDHAGAAPAGR